MLGTKPEPKSKNKAWHFKSYDRMVREYAIKNAAAGGKVHLTFIDVHRSFLAMGNNRNLYADDGIHMSPKGYAKWEEWTQQALADDTCVVWENGECATTIEQATQVPGECADIEGWVDTDGDDCQQI